MIELENIYITYGAHLLCKTRKSYLYPTDAKILQEKRETKEFIPVGT